MNKLLTTQIDDLCKAAKHQLVYPTKEIKNELQIIVAPITNELELLKLVQKLAGIYNEILEENQSG